MLCCEQGPWEALSEAASVPLVEFLAAVGELGRQGLISPEQARQGCMTSAMLQSRWCCDVLGCFAALELLCQSVRAWCCTAAAIKMATAASMGNPSGQITTGFDAATVLATGSLVPRSWTFATPG